MTLLCFVFVFGFVLTSGDKEENAVFVHVHEEEQPSESQESEQPGGSSNEDRVRLLRKVCAKYSDPFRPESAVVGDFPRSLGSEVVYLTNPVKEKVGSVCIPHKVGSNSWGKFVTKLNDTSSFKAKFDTLKWTSKANLAIRAVVVRHPMERLVSVYRMIFEDWCDPDRFLAKQWNNVCKFDEDHSESEGSGLKRRGKKDFSVTSFFASMLDEHQHGNDRFMRTIWERFHPDEPFKDPKSQLKFTFAEFVRFLVNGSQEFDLGVVNHKGLSYHWAPFWKECSLCDKQTRPEFILRLESFSQDLEQYLDLLNLGQFRGLFPHTHNQKSDPDLIRNLFGSLKKSEVTDLYDKYKLDHEMFGYNIQTYLNLAQVG